MQNQTAHSAAVRARLPAAQSADHGGEAVGRGDGDSTGATPAADSKRRTAASASSTRPRSSRKRTDSGSPHRTTTA